MMSTTRLLNLLEELEAELYNLDYNFFTFKKEFLTKVKEMKKELLKFKLEKEVM
ncbi:MAG: hypothetical protein ABGW69_00595 [Nanoarchaeota archaeon]